MAWMRQDNAERMPPPVRNQDSRPAAPAAACAPEVKPVARIGKTIQIKGEIRADEDLIIDGQVDGKVFVKKNRLTVGNTGRLHAEVRARWLVLSGEVKGNVTAGDRLEITATGRLHGDIRAPRLAIADGATLKGTIDTDPVGSTAGKRQNGNQAPDPGLQSARPTR